MLAPGSTNPPCLAACCLPADAPKSPEPTALMTSQRPRECPRLGRLAAVTITMNERALTSDGYPKAAGPFSTRFGRSGFTQPDFGTVREQASKPPVGPNPVAEEGGSSQPIIYRIWHSSHAHPSATCGIPLHIELKPECGRARIGHDRSARNSGALGREEVAAVDSQKIDQPAAG